MARVALYYPHWGIHDPRFMFDSLLYWDRLACIVPFHDFHPSASWPEPLQRECDRLHDTYVTGLAPSAEVKERVHDRLEKLLDTEPPAWALPENLAPSLKSVLAVRKMSSRTTEMLTERGWLARQGDDYGLISRAAAGLLLGAFAAEIGSETMPPVTDEPETFRAACNGLLRELQARQGISAGVDGGFRTVGETVDGRGWETAILLARIIKLGSDDVIDAKTLRRLHDLCQDSGFAEQRERFRGRVDSYLAELRKHPVAEHALLQAHWEMELARDRKALKRELRAASIESLVEKEGLVATGLAAAAGTGVYSVAGPAGLVVGIGLAGAAIGDRVRVRRTEVREKHWTSWLDLTSA